MDANNIEIFLHNVETLVSERGLSKQAFCDKLNFSRSSFINWKNKASIPNGEVIAKIADFFAVDYNWLIYGKIKLPSNYDSYPEAVFSRIYYLLLEETKIPNPDYHNVSLKEQAKIWKPISNIISCYELFNWQFNRIMPTYSQLRALANHFKKTIEYIADGIDDSIPDYIETYRVRKDEYEDYCRFKEYKYFMYSYDCLYKPDKKYVSTIVQRLFRLRRKIENRDFDFDYNGAHPLEEPRELDPNISDEEYAEMRKKDSR